tara:strand:+ start:591 stop:1469 length:879 start_codon:yes stop_codon:yes gene_type:complete
MNTHNLKLHELQTQMNALAVEEAFKLGKKITVGIRAIAQGAGVDYATMKGLIYGTIKNPSERTLGRVRSFLDDKESKTALPEDERFDALNTEIQALKKQIVAKDKDREALRLRFVDASEKLNEIEAADPDNADRYQTVHPDNSYWMRNSDAFIKIYTWGPEVNYEMVDKNRVCTIPIPETSGRLRWHTKLPTQRREKKNGDVDWVVSDEWKMVQEDEFGQHWEKPEDDHSPIQTCLVESREQYESRQAIHRKKNVDTIMRIAKDIYAMYSDCGDWPDNEVGVDVLLANINNF